MMKKSVIILTFAALFCTAANGQKVIALDPPQKDGGSSIMKAFDQRKSSRELSDRELTSQDLSNLLWAANGFNRPDKRTAGTAMNQQEIDVYVITKDGAYLYDAQPHTMVQIKEDPTIHNLVAGDGRQEFAQAAPVILLVVADMTRCREDNDVMRRMNAYDAGIVSQNISLFCSGNGMGTVCRAGMDFDGIRNALGLPETVVLHLNHPVGYLK